LREPTFAASAAVFRGGKVLIARRVKRPRLWSLPGGRIERGERAEKAAEREVFEETGVRCETVGLAGQREVILRDQSGTIRGNFLIIAFAARWVGGEARPGPEASAVEWVEPEKLSAYELTEGLLPIVLSAQRLV